MSFDTETLIGTKRFQPQRASPEATILLVEDEKSIRTLIARLLARENFHVLTAEDSRSALANWGKQKLHIDLLLTDVVMPNGLSGRKLAEQLQAERPALKVLYTSGYNADLLKAEGSLAQDIHFLQKPYRPEELLTSIRSILAGPVQSHSQSLC